ncbi:rod shape-determining protein MreC [Bacillaceae bacterium]
MSNLFANKRLLVLLLSLILLVILLGVTLRERPHPTWPEKFVKDTVSWIQGLFYQPAHLAAGFFENLRGIYRVYEENQALKASLEPFAQVTAERNRLAAENRRLREMLDAKSQLNAYELSFAEVVARSPDRWNNVITIDKGARDGIKANMAVITPAGMVGRVQSVANFYSTVELLTDIERGNHISAIVQGKEEEAFGVLEGFDYEKGQLIMRKIPIKAKIERNDLVVTSGLGGVIPPGLLIGKVVKVVTGDYGLTKTAYVQPEADLFRVREVFVVIRSLPAPIPAQTAPEGREEKQ